MKIFKSMFRGTGRNMQIGLILLESAERHWRYSLILMQRKRLYGMMRKVSGYQPLIVIFKAIKGKPLIEPIQQVVLLLVLSSSLMG